MHKVGWAALYTEDASAVLREGVVRTFWPSLKASFLSFRGCVLICVAEHFSVFFVRTLCSLCRKTNLNTKTTKQNQQRPQRKQEPLPLSVLFEILANSALKSFQTRRKTHSPRKTHCQLNFLLVICGGLMLNFVSCSLYFVLFSQTSLQTVSNGRHHFHRNIIDDEPRTIFEPYKSGRYRDGRGMFRIRAR